MRTMFALGLPVSSAPWSYDHSLGVSLKDVEGWWKTSLPGLKKDLESLPGQSTTPTPAPTPMAPPMMAPSSDSTGTILIAVLLLGGAAGGYYFWKKSQKKNGKAAK